MGGYKHFAVFLLLLSCLPQTLRHIGGSKPPCQILEGPSEASHLGPKQFCYINSLVPHWRQTWTRTQVGVQSPKELKVIVAEDEEKLKQEEAFSVWKAFQWFLHKHSNETTINISLYSKKTCFKIEPKDARTPYTVKTVHEFDKFRFAVSLVGVLLFVFAESLSRSQVFYYSTGMSTGLFGSILILIFVLSRFLPLKKGPFYMLVFGGWSLSAYVMQSVYRNINGILQEHWQLVLGYTAAVGYLSFLVCYRYGPLVEERSIKILSWTLQLFGLMLIYAGIRIQPVAIAIILAALCSKNLDYPASLAESAWQRIQPLLTLSSLEGGSEAERRRKHASSSRGVELCEEVCRHSRVHQLDCRVRAAVPKKIRRVCAREVR